MIPPSKTAKEETLLQLVTKRNRWDAIVDRIKSHPNECSEDLFYQVLQKPSLPLHVANAFLEMYPQARREYSELMGCLGAYSWHRIIDDATIADMADKIASIKTVINNLSNVFHKRVCDVTGSLLVGMFCLDSVGGRTITSREVMTIVDVYPDSLAYTIHKSADPMVAFIPLCYAVQCRNKFRVIKEIIERAIENKTFEADVRGGLFYCCRNKVLPLVHDLSQKVTSVEQNAEFIDYIFDEDSNLIRTEDVLKYRLVHEAAQGNNIEWASNLIKICPEALSIRDKRNKLPLHLSFTSNDVEMFRMVLNEGRDKLNDQDAYRDLFETDCSSLILDEVGKSEQDWSRMDLCMEIPNIAPRLVTAITSYRYPQAFIDDFYHRFPNCATIENELGQTALHCAIESVENSCYDPQGVSYLEWRYTIEKILEANPLALLKRDPSTRLLPFTLFSRIHITRHGISESRRSEMETSLLFLTYRLLRRDPDQLFR